MFSIVHDFSKVRFRSSNFHPTVCLAIHSPIHLSIIHIDHCINVSFSAAMIAANVIPNIVFVLEILF